MNSVAGDEIYDIGEDLGQIAMVALASSWGGSNRGNECRERLAHDNKDRIVAAILRERNHLVRECPAIQGDLLHSLVNMALILHLKLIG